MSTEIITRNKSRRRWLIPAITSVTTLVCGVFGSIIAPKVERLFGADFFWMIWPIFAIASVITIIFAIIEAKHKNESLPLNGMNNFKKGKNISVENKFVGRDQKISRDVVGRDKITNITANIYEATPQRPGSAPSLSPLIIGRENDIRDLKARLKAASVHVFTAVRGWPGVGKTTIASALAHDHDLVTDYPDGVLWVSLGQTPNLLSELAAWGRALGNDDFLKVKTVEEASAQLAALLRNKRMLLIVDDVWEPEHAMPFKAGGHGCAMLVTTRINSVAEALAPTPNDIYKLAVLTVGKAFELLQMLAPTVVAQYPEQSLELARELEGLPLALQVAGHMLNVEADLGFEVTDLLVELREGARLLETKAPADRIDLTNLTTPTVAVLLQKSTERLDDHTRDCFAYLGAFAPRPATFNITAMKAVWKTEDPKAIIRRLVDRGLLEPVVSDRFQMHALLVMHARSLFTEK